MDDNNSRCIPYIVGKICLGFQADAPVSQKLPPINASTGVRTRTSCCKRHTFLFLEEVEAPQQCIEAVCSVTTEVITVQKQGLHHHWPLAFFKEDMRQLSPSFPG